MFGWLFKNAVATPQEQGSTAWQDTPTADDPPCTCRDCQRARAIHAQDLGLIPGVAPRPRPDVRGDIDPTVYRG